MSLLFLIAGIWLWIGVAPIADTPITEVNGKKIEFPNDALTLYIPSTLGWMNGSPEQYPTGDFFVGDAEILGYAILPEGVHLGTNLFDAYLQVAVSRNGSEEQCRSGQQEGDTQVIPFTRSGKVAGRDAYVGAFNGAAAGTFFEGIVTHVYANGTCYEFSNNIFSGNIGNYPEGTVKEFPENEVRSVLQSIIDSAEITTQ